MQSSNTEGENTPGEREKGIRERGATDEWQGTSGQEQGNKEGRRERRRERGKILIDLDTQTAQHTDATQDVQGSGRSPRSRDLQGSELWSDIRRRNVKLDRP